MEPVVPPEGEQVPAEAEDDPQGLPAPGEENVEAEDEETEPEDATAVTAGITSYSDFVNSRVILPKTLGPKAELTNHQVLFAKNFDVPQGPKKKEDDHSKWHMGIANGQLFEKIGGPPYNK